MTAVSPASSITSGNAIQATLGGCRARSDRRSGMRITPQMDTVSVAVVGYFNPAIFTPAWFALHELLPQGAATSAELNLAHPEITQFQSDWLNLQVTRDRFVAQTTQAPYIRVCDLAVRVFKDHLPHTPLSSTLYEFGQVSACNRPIASSAADRPEGFLPTRYRALMLKNTQPPTGAAVPLPKRR